MASNRPDAPVLIGLTGGIASGKSTVSRMFEDLGAHVIDADVIAREIVEPGEPALAEIEEAFGAHVIREDGTLDRAALGERIFVDDEARSTLNGITHPRIGQRMMHKAQAAFDDGFDWVLYDAALIVENGLHQMLDSLVVVSLDRDPQRQRLMARDDMSAEEADERIDSQLSLEQKVAVADYVIDNSGDREETREQVVQTYQTIDARVSERHTAKPPAD